MCGCSWAHCSACLSCNPCMKVHSPEGVSCYMGGHGGWVVSMGMQQFHNTAMFQGTIVD